MHSKTTTAAVALAFILGAGSSLLAQQKGQYVPGQVGPERWADSRLPGSHTET